MLALSTVQPVFSQAQSGPLPPTPTRIAPPTQTAVGTATSGEQRITLVTLEPSAERLSGPAAPPRQFLFRFRGKKKTHYTATFATDFEPATVVGVGADIESTSFDFTSKQLTVSFYFDLSIVNEDGSDRDPNEFIIILDPGAPREFSPQPRPTSGFSPPPKPKSTSTLQSKADSTECYGPASKTTPTADQKGPPLQAAGTWMSTNINSWCVIPPNETNPFFGFKLIAPPGTKGYFRKKISPALLNLLSTLAGRTLDPQSLAIFNGTFEASKSITATSDGGVLVDIKLNFASNINTLSQASNSADAISSRKIKLRSTSSTVTKTVTTAEEEALSLTPKTSQVSTSKASLFGFVDDPSLAGKKVLLQRKVSSKIKSLRSSLKTVGTATISSTGSYSKSISSSKLFSGKKSATITASIVGDSARSSRSVSLSNKTGSLRQ